MWKGVVVHCLNLRQRKVQMKRVSVDEKSFV